MQTSGIERGVTLEVLRARRDEIERIAASRGAHNIRVFGSVARGEAGPESDIDFLVDFEPGRTVLELSGLILDLQDLLLIVAEGSKGDPVEMVGAILRSAVVAGGERRIAPTDHGWKLYISVHGSIGREVDVKEVRQSSPAGDRVQREAVPL